MKRTFSFALVLVLTLALGGAALASTPGELLIWADDTRAPVMEDLGRQFEAEFGVPVKVTELGFGDIRSQLAVAGPAGEGPDIIVGAHDWLGELIVNGLIEPIDLGDLAGDFEQVTLDAFTWGDQLYGVPIAFESIGLIYNKALVPTPPATWDELLDMAAALTDREQGYYGFLMQMPDPYHTFPLFSATGGYVFGTNPDGTLNPLDVGLNNEGSVRGLEVFDHLIESGLLPVGTDYNTMTSLFNQGRVGMIISGPWALGDAAAAGIDFGFTRIPTIDGGQPAPFVGVQGFMVSAFSENKILAEVFLKEFVVNTDTYLAMFARDPRPPAYKPALDQLEDNLIVQGVRESGGAGVPMPSIPEMGSVWTAWSDAIELVMNQELEPKEALDIAVQQILDLIRSSR
ncbi:MAG: maltose ABC transporter substrate-binding protein [Limnochordales bacterium]|nr:MAG: maltose ABC transporter substrate-binding protein [Bacillota bacterium]